MGLAKYDSDPAVRPVAPDLDQHHDAEDDAEDGQRSGVDGAEERGGEAVEEPHSEEDTALHWARVARNNWAIRCSELPADHAVCFDDGTEVPVREPVAVEVGRGGDRRHAVPSSNIAISPK